MSRVDHEAVHVVTNGRVVTPDGVVRGGVRVEGDRIVAAGDVSRGDATTVDAEGQYVLPGLVDLHGDDIESHLHPRSGARMPTHTAVAAADMASLTGLPALRTRSIPTSSLSQERSMP